MIWLILSILVFLILLGLLIAFIVIYRGKKHKPNYYSLFTIGIVWFILGIPLENFFLTGLGTIFMIVGLIHKNEWKNYKKKKLSDLTKEEKKLRVIILTGLALLVIFGLVFFILGMVM